MHLDMSAKNLYAISHDPTGIFTNERIQTCNDKHRSWSLENLALQYQAFVSVVIVIFLLSIRAKYNLHVLSIGVSFELSGNCL
jgi:hypothetical protein